MVIRLKAVHGEQQIGDAFKRAARPGRQLFANAFSSSVIVKVGLPLMIVP